MKKIILVASLIIGLSFSAQAQNTSKNALGLRLGDNKKEAILYDISDDMTYKSRKNFTLEHFIERMKIYNDEKFEYKIYTLNLKEE